jgi:catechol 2,3-dioxygenase-like lactoylglutathione lyase family enzyme
VPGRVVRYHHVNYGISRANIAAARRFYGELLGLTEIPPVPDPTRTRLIWFQVESQQLHLAIRDSVAPEKGRHIALHVLDLEDLVNRLAASGVPLQQQASGQFWGRREDTSKFAFCFDPDGNRIELVETVDPV